MSHCKKMSWGNLKQILKDLKWMKTPTRTELIWAINFLRQKQIPWIILNEKDNKILTNPAIIEAIRRMESNGEDVSAYEFFVGFETPKDDWSFVTTYGKMDKPWSVTQCCEAQITLGNNEYIELKNLCQKIPSLLLGKGKTPRYSLAAMALKNGTNYNKVLSSGKFKTNNAEVKEGLILLQCIKSISDLLELKKRGELTPRTRIHLTSVLCEERTAKNHTLTEWVNAINAAKQTLIPLPKSSKADWEHIFEVARKTMIP